MTTVPRVARPTQTLVDRTPLDGAAVDPQVRLGWMLRTARVHAGVSMAEMSARLEEYGVATSLAMVSVVERTGLRDRQIIDGYEHALGLPMGWLRAPIDVLCHMWHGSAADRNPHPVWLRDRGRFDQLHERVDGDAPTGGDWFHFARFVAPTDSGWALPSRLLRPLMDRLVHEVVRSVGPAYSTRYCALSHFQAGDSAPVVEESLRALVAEEGGDSVVINALGAVSEHPTRSLL